MLTKRAMYNSLINHSTTNFTKKMLVKYVTTKNLKEFMHVDVLKHLKKILRPKYVHVVCIEITEICLLEKNDSFTHDYSIVISGVFLSKYSANKRVSKLEKEYEAITDKGKMYNVYSEKYKLIGFEKPTKK